MIGDARNERQSDPIARRKSLQRHVEKLAIGGCGERSIQRMYLSRPRTDQIDRADESFDIDEVPFSNG